MHQNVSFLHPLFLFGGNYSILPIVSVKIIILSFLQDAAGVDSMTSGRNFSGIEFRQGMTSKRLAQWRGGSEV